MSASGRSRWRMTWPVCSSTRSAAHAGFWGDWMKGRRSDAPAVAASAPGWTSPASNAMGTAFKVLAIRPRAVSRAC
jgi:hypothetical protein